MESFIPKAIKYLEKSLGKVPSERNEIDWKEGLSPKNEKLCKHISAFANLTGGGFLVFGIEDKTAQVVGIQREEADNIVERLSSLCSAGVNHPLQIDHAIKDF